MIPEPSKVGVVRKFAAIVVAAAFVVSVAACADLPAEVQGCVPTYHAGSASKAITASGAIGSVPKVHVPTPTTTTKVENSVATEGKGLILGKGDIAEISSLLYDGKTGKIVGATATTAKYSKSTAVQVPVGDKSTVLPTTVTNALMCARVGSR
ncbi:MAG TPA: hypothetical protein VK537_04860, partial [Galbitalea sp.]|nr:hypothetical protein [Galbitalea sp.]